MAYLTKSDITKMNERADALIAETRRLQQTRRLAGPTAMMHALPAQQHQQQVAAPPPPAPTDATPSQVVAWHRALQDGRIQVVAPASPYATTRAKVMSFTAPAKRE